MNGEVESICASVDSCCEGINAMMPLSTNQTKHVGAAVVFPYALGNSVLTFNGSCDVAINGFGGVYCNKPRPNDPLQRLRLRLELEE